MKLPRRALQILATQDPQLGRWIDQLPKFKIEADPMTSVPEVLTHSIVYQQLHGKAAETILNRFLALLPRKKYVPAEVLKLRDEQARGAGLSGSKWLAIQDVARKQLEGVLPSVAELDSLSDAEIVEKLTIVRGVGPWTVHMLLLFRLGRPDVLPSTDYGVRQGFKLAFKKRHLPTPKALERYAEERWKPYRSIAAWYLWRIVEHHRDL